MIYLLENEQLAVEISSFGAELQSIYRKDLKINYLWRGDEVFWARRSPILFPIIGRLQHDRFEYNHNTYTMGQHGFARDKAFTVVAQTENSITFELLYSSDTLAIYPFLFQLRCQYIIEQHSIMVKYEVTNLSSHQDMYYSIGAHPAFSTQLCQDDNFEDYTITFNSTEPLDEYQLKAPYLVETPINQVVNPHINLSYNLFKVDTLIYGVNSKPVELVLQNKHFHGIKMAVDNSDFLGVWTPNGKEAPFICLEPWQGVADTTTHNGLLTQKLGIKLLQPKQSNELYYNMTVF